MKTINNELVKPNSDTWKSLYVMVQFWWNYRTYNTWIRTRHLYENVVIFVDSTHTLSLQNLAEIALKMTSLCVSMAAYMNCYKV
jgi:hypothetical protein